MTAPTALMPTGEYLGTHGAQVHTDAAGSRWLVKPQEDFMNHLDVGTAALSQAAGLTTPETHLVDTPDGMASAQRMLDSRPAFSGRFDPSRLTPADRLSLQKQHALDWMLSNHDAHPGQFLRTTDGQLVGIDKGQAYRYFGRDKLDSGFHPNEYYGEREPVYNTMWRDYARGGGEMADPRTGELGQFINRLQSLPDEQVRSTLRPYAQAAAATGKLMGTGGGQPGLTPQTLRPNDPEAFLDAVISRKNSLANDFGALYDRTTAARNAPHVAAVLREAGIKTAMPPRSIDTEVALLPAPDIEEDPPLPRKKREPQPVQTSLFAQPKKVKLAPEGEENDPSAYHDPDFEEVRGTQSPLSTDRDFNWSQMLPMNLMVQSMLDKYHASDDDTKHWGEQWYPAATEYIQNLAHYTGLPTDTVAGVVAAMSPRTAWDPNLAQATHFLLNHDPENPDALNKAWPGLGENLERAKRVYDARTPEDVDAALGTGGDAPKIRNFYRNLMGDPDAVTMDTWMARALMGKGLDVADSAPSQQALSWVGGYDRMAEAVRQAAGQLGVDPRALQAIVWTQVNPTASYGDWTPDQIKQRVKYLQNNPAGKPLPDYTKGPGYQYLPDPSYLNRRNAAFEVTAEDYFSTPELQRWVDDQPQKWQEHYYRYPAEAEIDYEKLSDYGVRGLTTQGLPGYPTDERLPVLRPDRVNPEGRAWGGQQKSPRPTTRQPYTDDPNDMLDLDFEDGLPREKAPVDLWRGLKVDLSDPAAAEIRAILQGSEGAWPGSYRDPADFGQEQLYAPERAMSHYQFVRANPDLDEEALGKAWWQYQKSNRYDGPQPTVDIPGSFDSPELGPKILDLLSDGHRGGLGKHWSTSDTVANQFAGLDNPSVRNDRNILPVRVKAQWPGLGEDTLRTNTGDDFPDEKEITLLPDAQLDVHDLQVWHPDHNKWMSVLPSPQSRTAGIKDDLSVTKAGGPEWLFPYSQEAQDYYTPWLNQIDDDEFEDWDTEDDPHVPAQSSFDQYLANNGVDNDLEDDPWGDTEADDFDETEADDEEDGDGFDPDDFYDPKFEDRPTVPGNQTRRVYLPNKRNPMNNTHARPEIDFEMADPEQPMLPLGDPREGLGGWDRFRQHFTPPTDPDFVRWVKNNYEIDDPAAFSGSGLLTEKAQLPRGGKASSDWDGVMDAYLNRGKIMKRWPKDNLGTPLYRGLSLDLSQPELAPIRRALYGGEHEPMDSAQGTPSSFTRDRAQAHPLGWDNPDLGAQILDHLGAHGKTYAVGNSPHALGPHWSTDKDTSKEFASSSIGFGPGNPLHVPVLVSGQWKGLGEDPYRTNTGGNWPEEKEITLLPGAPVDISDVHIRNPHTGEWHSVLGEPQQRAANLGRVAGGSDPYSLPSLWKDYQDWNGSDEDYPAQDSVQSWGNVEEYLRDRHGLNPYDDTDTYFSHPATIGAAKLHTMAQGKNFVDGTNGELHDDDLLQGAALGLLKIRRDQHNRLMPERLAMSDNPDDYRGVHEAPDADYGASMDNPDMMFPDIDTHPEYYDTYQPYDYQSHSVIRSSRGKPDRKVSIYRALPMSAVVKDKQGHFFPLNTGDWVTPSYDYAKEHGESNLHNEPWTILYTKVPAGQLYSEGNSIHEWAYQGDNKLTTEHPRARQQRYRRTKASPAAPE